MNLPMKGRPWTTEHIGVLRRMWEEGRSSTEIASVLHRTRAAILQRATILGLREHPTKFRWTPELDARLLELRAQGVFYKNIAYEFGCSHTACVNRAALLANREERRELRKRVCLNCNRSFESEGNHDRLCNPCGKGDAWEPYPTHW